MFFPAILLGTMGVERKESVYDREKRINPDRAVAGGFSDQQNPD
jgi:hypothetical protein